MTQRPRTERLSPLAWGLVDQVLSSARNFGGSVFAARALGVEEFGAFALAFSVYLLALGITKAWTSDVMMVRFSATPLVEQRQAIGLAAGAAALLGIGLGALLVLVGAALGGPIAGTFLAIAVVLPFVLVQDVWRSACFMIGRQRSAAFNDAVWLAFLVLAFVALPAERMSGGIAVWAWGFGGVLAAVLGLFQFQRSISFRVREWLSSNRGLSDRYTVEFALSIGIPYVLTFLLAATSGLEATASFRGAQVVMGPLNVVFMAVAAQALPVMVRQHHRDPRAPLRTGAFMSGALGALVLSWGTVLALAPNSVGEALLGSSWESAQPVVIPVALMYAGAAVSMGAYGVLRSAGAATRSMRIRLLASPLPIAAGVTGALLGASFGLAMGLALTNGLISVIVWMLVIRDPP